MGNAHAVVITDTGTPRQLLRCVRQVMSTVEQDVDVVVVSRDVPQLGRLASRARRVQVRSGESLEQVARAHVAPDRVTVVARSQCRWSAGWLDALVRSMSTAGSSFGVLGDPIRYVEVYTGQVAPAPPVDLGTVPGIALPVAADGTVTSRTTGHASPVTISACLIVKDEEESIERCLTAVATLVDEVVVYDTGSVDRTAELAEAAGARVVRGYWDDDFGAARNRSLAHCTGDWILQVDADEIAKGDRQALAGFLSGTRGDLVHVPLVNVSWDGGDDGDEYAVERLFRRASGVWQGAVHERVVSRHDDRSLALAPSKAPIRLLHLGYTSDRMKGKAKRQRNLDIARARMDAGSVSAADWCNYGRSLALADKPLEALAALSEMLDLPAAQGTIVLGARTAVECLHAVGHTQADLERWLQVLTEHGEAPGRVAVERARLALSRGDVAHAAEVLADLATDSDCWGIPFDPDDAAGLRAEVLFRQGQSAASLSLLLDTVARRIEAVPLTMMLLAALRAELPLRDLVRKVPDRFVSRSLREVLHLDAEHADAWLDALWQEGSDPRVLVAADLVCRGLGLDRVLVWQMRCLESGSPVSPLASIAGDEHASTSSRCLANALLGDVLGDDAARCEAVRLLALVDDAEQPALLATLSQFAPGVIDGLPTAGGALARTS